MANLIKDLQEELSTNLIDPRTKESRDWFIQRVKEITRVDRRELMSEDPLELTRKVFPIGRMYMFLYNPIGKETLPYYDRFPVVITVKKLKDGFTGLNLHYLPLIYRARLLENLQMVRLNNKRYDETTRFRLTYDILNENNRFRFFRPCFKRYKMSRIRGNLALIHSSEWEVASYLPVAFFRKRKEPYVHMDSRRIIRENM